MSLEDAASAVQFIEIGMKFGGIGRHASSIHCALWLAPSSTRRTWRDRPPRYDRAVAASVLIGGRSQASPGPGTGGAAGSGDAERQGAAVRITKQSIPLPSVLTAARSRWWLLRGDRDRGPLSLFRAAARPSPGSGRWQGACRVGRQEVGAWDRSGRDHRYDGGVTEDLGRDPCDADHRERGQPLQDLGHRPALRLIGPPRLRAGLPDR
jgi:hypothetical protein